MKLLAALALFLVHLHCSAQDTIKVYFDLGASSLNGSAMRQLDSLAYYEILIPNKNYGIIGYADYLGSEESNVTLSQNRAGAVQQYLQGLGIKQENIETVTGKGEITRDLPSNEGYPEDRRADIVLGGFKKDIQQTALQQKKAVLPPPSNQPVATKPKQKIDIGNLQAGDVFDLENMFFMSGSTVMIERSLPALEALLEMMQQNTGLKIRIEGHVHCYDLTIKQYMPPNADTTEYNVRVGGRHREHPPTSNKWQNIAARELSMARAKIVHDYLVDHGISGTRLQYTGLGCEGMSEHKDNRRVAIRILEK